MMDAEATTRDRLVDAAMRLFLDRGYEATAVSAVLKAADARSGSLYYSFPSKEDLLIGVLEKYLEMVEPVILAPAEERASDPIERVFVLLRMYREFLVTTGCRYGCPIGNLALEISDHHEEARKLVLKNFDDWCAGVQRWLEAAGDRLPKDIDRAGLARFILTVMEGGQMQAKAEKRIDPYDASMGQLRNYIECLKSRAEKERENAAKR